MDHPMTELPYTCQAVQELLPWYANGTLRGEERTHVVQHLATCGVCQQELTLWRGTAALVQAVPEEAPQLRAPEESLAALLAHIDAMEAATPLPWWQRLWQSFEQYTMTLWDAPRPVRWTLALASLLVVILAGTLWRTALPGSTYQTLSQPETASALPALSVRVVFADDMMERDIRALLLQVQASFVQGPSRLGVYTVVLENSPPQGMRVEQRLQSLRAHPQVRLAEPVLTP